MDHPIKLRNLDAPERPRPKEVYVDTVEEDESEAKARIDVEAQQLVAAAQVPQVPKAAVTPRPPARTAPSAPRIDPQVVVEEVKDSLNIPGEYRVITLSSAGRLGMPELLHVRDYNGADTQKLATMMPESQLEVMLGVLQGLIWEKIDVMQLHEEDVKEILLNIHLLFWGPDIKDYFFPFTDEEFNLLPAEKRKRIESGEEYPLTDVHIPGLGTRPISEEAKEPILIQNDDTSIEFRAPRIGDEVYAERMVSKHFAREAEEMRRIQAKLRQEQRAKVLKQPLPEIDAADREEYMSYQQNREAMKRAIQQAQQLVSYNGKVLDTLEEKINVQKRISTQWWAQLKKITDKYFQFGIDGIVEMVNPWTQEVVNRRVQFQPMELIPSDRLEGINQFTVKLGGE